MDNFNCKYCGSSQFKKTKIGQECLYCHAVYEKDNDSTELFIKNHKSKKINKIFLFIAGLFVFISITAFVFSKLTNFNSHKDKVTSSSTSYYKNTTSNSSRTDIIKNTYDDNLLKNPDHSVKVAELSLVQSEIDLARASVKKYGGDDTKKFEKLLDEAQKEHDEQIKNRVVTPPKPDMIIDNPDSEFSITTYYREGGSFLAYNGDYNQYTSQDIINLWGHPDKVITDPDKIKKSLSIDFGENKHPNNYETKVLQEQWKGGKITWRELRSFIAQVNDSTYGTYSKEFIYESQGKPNVYFENDNVSYVTPILRYVFFPRLPEKYPKEGLGKYPDDFPSNYGMDGYYHEK
ncbi:hypothetical protein BG262_03010 [Floricoccus penangensis]|uniref:DUF4947 domain-containing protein n=2 Tax=Floricoccus penangensis TaxID=1859475 RepID=A0A9Q5JG74_9LACT|nr:hypothetical protein BG262_03010 [Floricoccus penangensis]